MIRVDPDAVTAIIREVAAEHILPYFGKLKTGDIAFKTGDDPVTIADKQAELALSNRFLDLLPGSKVVGEEAFASNQGILGSFSGESPVWIIDPVDGTRNFTQNKKEFGVIVALAERNQTIAGWIYDPTSDEVLTAEKGAGAYYQSQKLKVLPPKSLKAMQGILSDRLIVAHENSNYSKSIEPVFKPMTAGSHEYPLLVLNQPHFSKNAPQIHFRASLAYSTPWDDAAGILIHGEAGGHSAFWSGEAYQPSVMHKGLATAPDKDSWQELKAWCRSFANPYWQEKGLGIPA